MMDEYIKKIVKQQVNTGKISSEDKELYEYGYRLVAEKMVASVMTIAIAVFFHAYFQVLMFYIVFIPMRTYAGGYHAETTKKCILLSGGILILYILTTKILLTIPYGRYIYVAEFIIIPAIWRMAPVQHKNKPLTESERKYYQKIARGICMIHVISEIILLMLSKEEIVICFMLSHGAVLASLILGLVTSKSMTDDVIY